MYHRATVFNAQTYLDFLEQVARHYYPRHVFWIQDNAAYHKDADVWRWFGANRSWWHVTNLPPYSAAVQEATGLPVFDSVGLIRMVHRSVTQQAYGSV